MCQLIEPDQVFGWQAKDEAGKPVWSFVFGLVPIDEAQTRLVVCESFAPVAIPAAALALGISDVVMELKMLNTLKQCAEGQTSWALTTVYEISVWLATFAIDAIAGLLYLRRSAWQKPLAVGAVAWLALLALTFLFLPFWLRGGLVVMLLLGLVWSWRGKVEAQRPDLPVSLIEAT
ncbi:MAG: hypothetical protein KDE47_11525 [Caldilineaceae bacterium]|nr:hypothetical protein [Caldilineaceae bacterium]